MAISKADKLAIYRKNLERYKQEGDAEKVAVQERLNKRIEAEA